MPHDPQRPDDLRFLGIDLAWGEGTTDKAANESGVVALDPDGTIVDAGWAVGLEAVVDWIERWATANTMLFVDAPLVVPNETGMRQCEKEVSGNHGGHWKVGANASNRQSLRSAGVKLRRLLEPRGWAYADGTAGPVPAGRTLSECYPYTALVGAHEFGYVRDRDDKIGERPRYKRGPKGMPAAEWHPIRAATCDALIERFATFAELPAPIDLASHPATAALVAEPSPLKSRDYKHREDLIDAAICAWTAAFWHHAPERCIVLGAGDERAHDEPGLATIIAPRVLEAGAVPRFERVPAMVTVAAPGATPKTEVVALDSAPEPEVPVTAEPRAPAVTPTASRRPAPAAVTVPGSLDFERARRFIAAIPAGRWSSYGDVAAAAGAPKGAQALGTWLLKSEHDIPNMHRVLRVTGQVGDGWTPADGDLPTTTDGVHGLLRREGVPFDAAGRAAQSARWTGPDPRR